MLVANDYIYRSCLLHRILVVFVLYNSIRSTVIQNVIIILVLLVSVRPVPVHLQPQPQQQPSCTSRNQRRFGPSRNHRLHPLYLYCNRHHNNQQHFDRDDPVCYGAYRIFSCSRMASRLRCSYCSCFVMVRGL